MAETTTMTAAAYTAKGTARDKVALPAELFDGTVNMPVMHQAVKAYRANQRQGNASTKTRGFVVGGNQKPWKQKGTGRARQGSTRAPNWVGGGTVFGPRPRSYAEAVPRKVRALARKSALNARARENAIIVIDTLEYDVPKTSQLVGLLGTLGIAGKKVLILTDGVKPNVYMSGRNLTDTQVLNYTDVSTYHILWSDVVVIEAPALGQVRAVAEENGEDAVVEAKASLTTPKKAAAKTAKKTAGR
ncbi:MAG TPA: 50S ribosomal protein L4, partial [Vicinamibacterales bacterium]